MKSLNEVIDLILFGLVVIVFAAVLFSGFGTGKSVSTAALSRAEEARNEVVRAAERDDYERAPAALELKRVVADRASLTTLWDVAPRAHPLEPGLFYHPASLADLKQGRDADVRFFPPQNVAAEAVLGVIRLIWSDHDRSTVRAIDYEIHRSDDGKPSQRLAVVPAAERSFEDRNVVAGSEYTYWIVGRTDDKSLVQAGRALSDRSAPTKTRAARDYEIKIVAFDGRTNRLRVQVRRYTQDAWQEKEFEVQRGETIGQVDPGSGIDYSTPCVVVDITDGSETKTETRAEVVFKPDGSVLVVDDRVVTRPVESTRTFRVITLRFKNESGETETQIWRP